MCWKLQDITTRSHFNTPPRIHTPVSYPQSPSPAGRPPHSLHYAVGEISGKLDQLILTLLPQMTDLDNRVTQVETRMWYAIGGGSVIVFLVTAYEVVRYVFPL